jgi:hypothetical protein
MDRATADHIEKEVLGRFPDGTLRSVQVLQYGEDPAIELIAAGFAANRAQAVR